jgi:multiple sugar transport system permease protein
MSTTAAPERPLRRKRRSRAFSRTDVFVLVALVAIPTIIHVALVWLPALATIALSFTHWTGIGGLENIKPAGLSNYKNILTIYPPFWLAVRNNALWLGFFALIATPLGILLAYQIDRQIRGHRFFQSAYYLPVVLSLAVTGIIWDYIFSPDGLANGLLGRSSDTAVSFFGDSRINIWVVLVIASWRHIGYIMLLYLAGLKAIDTSLREAASVDGASEWQTFRKVIFPAMRPVNVIVVVITIIESLRQFDLVFIINGGRNGLELLGVLVYENIAGEAARIGYGAALAALLFVLSLGPIIAYLLQTFRRDAE